MDAALDDLRSQWQLASLFHYIRVIGGPLPEFLGRLRNLAGAAMLAAAFLKFD